MCSITGNGITTTTKKCFDLALVQYTFVNTYTNSVLYNFCLLCIFFMIIIIFFHFNYRADSVTWNPHKLLTAPQQCSTFLTRHANILSQCNSTNATYLFQKDKFYDTKYDTGDKHIQCGRRADVLKFWFMWRAKGTKGLEQHVDTAFDCAEFFTQTIKQRPGFKMVLDQPECTNVCFWYIPPSLRNKPEPTTDQEAREYRDALHRVAPKVKERMMKTGSMMITYQPIHDKPNFFRLVIQNSGLTHDDMIHIIETIEKLAADL